MEIYWKAEDGTAFPALLWGDPATACAVMVCVHGLGGAHANFEPLGQRLADEGFLVAALTVRGQGLDPDHRRRGRFLDPEVIAADVRAFAAAYRRPGQPLFLCGESLGALLCAKMMAVGAPIEGLAGVIFSTPVVTLAKKTPWIVRYGLRALSLLAPNGSLSPGWFVTGGRSPLKTSRDEEWLRVQREGPQHVDAFSFGTLDAVGRLMAQMPDTARQIHVPSLVLAAGKDVFVREASVRDWYELLATTDKSYHAYPEAYHVLWNDFDREQVLNDIVDWLRPRVRV